MSIPYTYKMVDFSGLDLATINFSVVDGIYNKIVEAIGDWGVAVFYNWFFGEIPITPQHCQVTLEDGYLMINGIIKVTENDEVGVDGIEPQANLVELSVEDNGLYLPSTYDADGFSSVDVSVDPTLSELVVDTNGEYTPSAGVDGFSSVLVQVPSGAQLIANWDFTQSLVDSVKGLEVTLGNATRDSEGVHLTAINSYISLPPYLYGGYRTFEFEVGDSQAVLSGNHLRLFSFDADKGLIYRNQTNPKWSFYSGSWAGSSDISDINFFKNSVVKIETGDLYWKIYKNGELVYSPNIRMDNTGVSYKIGQTNYSFFPCVIKNLKVY